MPPHARVNRGALAAFVLGIALVLLAAASPAQAHDQLVSSNPGEGELVAAAPAEIVLTYSADILAIGAIVIVVDDNGTTFNDGDVTVEGRVARQPLLATMPDGAYQVRWQVVSSDGHTISGFYGFSVGDHPAAPIAAPRLASDADGATAVEVPTVTLDPLLLTVLTAASGAAIGITAFGLAVAIRRRSRRTSHPPEKVNAP